MAYNPEVAGSNTAPATKARGPFSNRERASSMWFVNGFVNVALAQAASPGSPSAVAPWSSRSSSEITVEARVPPMISAASVFATWR